MASKLFLLVLALISLFQDTNAVICRECSSVDSSCSADPIPTCTGDYCTFMNVTAAGKSTVLYKCSNLAKIVVEGKDYVDLNTCITGSTAVGDYALKICNDTDYCNVVCNAAMGHLQASMSSLLFVVLALWAFKG